MIWRFHAGGVEGIFLPRLRLEMPVGDGILREGLGEQSEQARVSPFGLLHVVGIGIERAPAVWRRVHFDFGGQLDSVVGLLQQDLVVRVAHVVVLCHAMKELRRDAGFAPSPYLFCPFPVTINE